VNHSGIEIRLMGRFCARRAGEEIPPAEFGGRLGRAFVRLLATRRGEFVAHDILADALWPRRLPADPAANLRVLANRARRAFGDPAVLVTGPGGYSLAGGDACLIDTEHFLAAVAAGRERLTTGEQAAALRHFRDALDRWGEPLAEDAYDEWSQPYRTQLYRAHLEALECGAAAALALRDPVQAVALAEQAVVREPLREPAYVLLARAQAATGDQAAALRVLDELRRTLADELGLDPSGEARRLEREILSGEPAYRPAHRPMVGPPRAVFHELAFVGRDDEMEMLLASLDGVQGGIALVSGSAGSGKTRLLREVAARCTRPLLAASAFLPDRDEAWSLARALLREAVSFDAAAARALPARAVQALADLVPELDELRPVAHQPLDPESRRALAFEGGVRLLQSVAPQGPVLVVDDLQWGDPTSLTLLSLVLRRVPDVAAIFGCRLDEVAPDDAVASFLTELAGIGRSVASVALPPLPQQAVRGVIAENDVAMAIIEETDRTPLAITEVMRALARQGVIEPDPSGGWRARTARAAEVARQVARAGQHQVIRTRVSRHPIGRREIVSLLALLGRETPARVLATAQGRDEREVLADLDVLSRGGLVRLGDNGWATAHDLIGESIAAALERADRGRLHQVVARALEIEGGDPAELGHHLAGAGATGEAARAFALAARQRLEGFAAQEAARLADAGLSLRPDPATRRTLLEVRGDARGRTGDLSGGRDDLMAAVAATTTGPERARLLIRIAVLTSGSDDYRPALELADLALTEAGSDASVRAEVLAAAAVMDAYSGRLDRARSRAEEALALSENVGDAAGVVRALDAQAVITMNAGLFGEATNMLDRAASLHRQSGQLTAVGDLRAARGWLLAFMDRADEGLSDVDEALELEQALNQVEGEAYGLWARAEVLAAMDRLTEGRANAEAALTLARQLQHRLYTVCALLGLGAVHHRAGELDDAERAYRQALDVAEDSAFNRSWAAGRLASVVLEQGDLAGAEAMARRCLAEGPPLVQYEAHLVLSEVALARGEPGAPDRVAESVARAEVGGYRVSPARRRLTGVVGTAPSAARIGVHRRERRTFMFTDIVRSTNLVEALGDEAWDELLRWHDETLRSMFNSYGGVEVNRVGDGFFVAFDQPKAAVECAISIQRALTRHRREHGFSPQVRIGLHHGEATRIANDYQGKGVHVAARIAALANGGEVLASASLLPRVPGVAHRDRRLLDLRGLSQPLEVMTINTDE
jgi:class 3 adenylate cyclase/DNA-binding SARP family transcriptional activator/predicted ATPase